MFKRKLKDRLRVSDAYTIVGLWIMAWVTAFVLIGANSRGIIWIFILGAFMSWWILTKKK